MTRKQAQMTCLVLTSLLLPAAGCANREHIRDDHGEKFRTHLAKQRVHQQPGTGSPSGLDSEEAAVVQAKYQAQLAGGKSSPRDASPVLILDQSREDD